MSDDTELSPLRRALLAIEDMRARVAAAEGAAHQPIAIVGMACRMPGADTPEELWELLDQGVDAIGEIPADRWDVDKLYDPDPGVAGKIVSREGGFVRNVDRFDPQFFGISPRESITLDPQQRLLLEVSWEALERAGIAPASLVGSNTGVYVGIGIYDYAHVVREAMESGGVELDAYVGTGNGASVSAGRIAFALGLNGPTLAVDTACSSSLVSVHLAVQALRAGETDVALAGGASLILTPGTHMYMSQLGALSPSGRCRTFDASADGYVRSEGVGMIVLKRLTDAVADGDTVLAVIRGGAVNHDGRSSGLTVPNGIAQQAVIRAALADARVDPGDVEFIEAHGTGTPLGDPIEVRALDAVYGPGRSVPLQVGSVKTNIGHLESASGIAGLLKVVLALQHGKIPAHLHLTEPTPHLDWDRLSIEVPTTAREWPRGEHPRVAGINSFGLSGTNSHMILSDPPEPAVAAEPEPPDAAERAAHVLTLSARSGAGLHELAAATSAALSAPDAPDLGDAAYTLNTGRNAFAHRLAVVTGSRDEAAAALDRFASDLAAPELVARDIGAAAAPKLAFLFTGQGAQYPGMTAALYATEPTFRDALDRCAGLFGEHLGRPLLPILHPAPGETSPIDDTTYTQPAIFAVEYALATMWDAWGVRPELMLGHSIGSYAAAHLAGVMSLDDAVRLVAARGRLMGSLPAGGSMAAAFAPEATVAEVVASIGGALSIAAINGPDNTVVSGPDGEVAKAIELLEQQGVSTSRLTTSHAFHSALMEPILDEFGQLAASVVMQPARRPRMVSDLTGRIAGDEVASPAYWVDHLRHAVRFADGMRTLRDEGANVFLEVGPAPTLTALGRRCVPEQSVTWAASLSSKRPDPISIGLAAGGLWTAGIDVDWRAFDAPYRRRRVVLPTAPFQRQRYWVPSGEVRSGSGLAQGHPLLGSPVIAPVGPAQFEVGINQHNPTLIAARRVHDRIEIGPGVFVESALAMAEELWGAGPVELTDLALGEPVEVKGMALRYGTLADRIGRDEAAVTVRVADLAGHHWEIAATTTIRRLDPADLAAPGHPTFTPPDPAAARDTDELYAAWREDGLAFGPRATCIDGLWADADRAVAHLTLPFAADRFTFYPPLVELCALALVAGPAARAIRRVGRIRVLSDAEPAWCVRDLGDDGNGNGDQLTFLDADGQPVATAAGFEFADLASIAAPPRQDWVYELGWRALGDEPIPPGQRPQVPSGTWLLVGDTEPLAGALAARGTPARQLAVADVDAGFAAGRDELAALVDELLAGAPALSHVVFVPPPAPDPDGDPTDAALTLTRALLHLAQVTTEVAWRRRTAVPPQFWVVTRGAIAVTGGDVTRAADGALWGLGRTIGAELPQFYGGMIDLDGAAGRAEPGEADPGEADAVVELITTSGDETWLARRAATTYVARLRAAPPPGARPGAVAVGGAHLITGGFGALGLATARSLVQRGAHHLVLVARSPVPPRAGWAALADDDPAQPRVAAIRELEALGATVHVASLDVADRAAVAAFLDAYRADGWPPIRGVFHAAGVLRDRAISDMTDIDVDESFGPKVRGAWNLHELLADGLPDDGPLDHFVLFSSAAGLLGSPGQANYAAANAVLDSIAHRRRQAGQAGLSVSWGAWSAGMADREDLAQQRARTGQLAIPVDAGMSLMFDLLAAEATHVLVMPMTHAQLVAAAASPLLSELVDTSVAGPAIDARRDHGAEILASERDERLALVLTLLRERIGGVLGLPGESVEPQSGLVELGLDSIMIVEMTTRLSVELGIGLNPREVFQESSVLSLAGSLLAALEQRPGAEHDDSSSSDTVSAADSDSGPAPGAGSILLVGAPGSGIAELRDLLATLAPERVDVAATATPQTFAEPIVALSETLADDPAELDALVDALPGLHVVHIARHPFAVLADREATVGLAAAEEAWRSATGNLLDLAERLGPARMRLVRVEDLIEGGDPVGALLALVGIPGGPGAAIAFDGSRLDSWRTAELPERPGRAVRQLADELGYDTAWPVQPLEPVRWPGV